MTSEVDTGAPQDLGPDLLIHWEQDTEPRRFLRAGAGSLLVHIVLVAFVIFLFTLPAPVVREATQLELELRKAVPLVAPLEHLTQKEPNRGPVAKEVTAEALMARAAHVPTPQQQPARAFKAPAVPPGPPQPKAPVLLPEAPKIETAARPPTNLPPGVGSPEMPPPPKQPSEQPKLALQNAGQPGSGIETSPGMPRITAPKNSVDEAIRGVVRGGGQGGVVVGDLDTTPSLADQLNQNPFPGAQKSSLELLSDPQGVDFKPYMIRILATVKRNWLAVIPESARFGRRGRVLLQFIIRKDGSVPKLVISMPSGTESFDRAAVAGISASLPFPPLPPEYKGSEIRLQFAFTYNLR